MWRYYDYEYREFTIRIGKAEKHPYSVAIFHSSSKLANTNEARDSWCYSQFYGGIEAITSWNEEDAKLLAEVSVDKIIEEFAPAYKIGERVIAVKLFTKLVGKIEYKEYLKANRKIGATGVIVHSFHGAKTEQPQYNVMIDGLEGLTHFREDELELEGERASESLRQWLRK